ncbi:MULTISPECIES: peptidyl-alpha-hydroxyglycine alpha-amidating lyase family protein [unclassified Chelatococcus]|uniref:peptidyl-alpha-hydroxyglycine alpha-amidating lyase family protein n=1 Tax=unclassified Chelatococcus TaxID=2638111 RepID=UPI001BCE3116|nr:MULTISPECIES: peptidyl-alpha-hydroxyglycine alpha-amidating lyase family protein [unclassified Chelatococcus]MBS7701555.1 hypothetical protein [Chelatococcus sp. YT9]MBX3557390.1 hypothetical protein [Chelatococcus sp.]
MVEFTEDSTWGKLPTGWLYKEVAAVAVDSRDNVYVFNRGEHPMIVFDRSGRFLRSWGEDMFTKAHGLHIGPDDSLYCTDEGDHTVRKCTPEGKILLQIGLPKQPSAHMSGKPFNRCTHTALSSNGDIFVSDGYGNACVHKYTAGGKYLTSWGKPGVEPGSFNVPHNIVCDEEDRIYVADRENHRIQIFDAAGRYISQWNNLHRPCALCLSRATPSQIIVGEVGPTMPVNIRTPNLGPRISILDREGGVVVRYGAGVPGRGVGKFIAPHGVAADSRGDIYVGEVVVASWPKYYPDTPIPNDITLLRKLVRQPDS